MGFQEMLINLAKAQVEPRLEMAPLEPEVNAVIRVFNLMVLLD